MAPRQTIQHERKTNNMIVFAILICFVLVIVIIMALSALGIGQTPASVESSQGASSQTLSTAANESPVDMQRVSAKLTDATETIDERGIVYGTTPEGISYTVLGRGEYGKDSYDSVSLVAVGDQIASDKLLALADSYDGSVDDGHYDLLPFYQEVAPFIDDYDLRYINQETCMAGEDYGIHGYPTFNSPDECAEALGTIDFNVISFCTNHTLDYGVDGALRTLDVLEEKTNAVVPGSYRSQDERDTVHMIERNGKNFAFLAYTYGDNAYGAPENFPNPYILCGFDKEAIRADVERAQKVADAVIVCMHWGTEYTMEPNEEQWDYAEFLADLDVDLVLGTHAHNMQPIKYVTGTTGNTIPVVFGLSDFVSGWMKIDTILSGLLTGEFTWGDPDAQDDVENGITVGAGGIALSHLKWYPTIEWSDGGQTYVRMLKDMDYETVNKNTRTEDASNDWEHIRDAIDRADMDIEVVI